MNKNKLVITDLDGTLLKSDGALPKGCIEAFEDLAKRGIKTAIVTARPKRSAEEYAKVLSCDAAAYDNGAYVYIGEKLIFNSLLSGEFVINLTKKLTEADSDIYIAAESDGKMYANHSMLANWSKIDAERCDFPKFPYFAASKLVIGADDSSKLPLIASYIDCDDAHIELAHSTVLVTTDKATKLCAAKKLAQSFGVEMSDVYAFGDDIGDVELLRSVGHPYCVENGHPMAKASAKLIPSNDMGGVVTAIIKDIL